MCSRSSRREGLSRSFGRSSHRNRRRLSPDRPQIGNEELDHVRRIPVRRKGGVEHLPHSIALQDERESLQEDLILERKGRQAEGSGPRSILIAEEFEREVESLDRLPLPLRRVDADAVYLRPESRSEERRVGKECRARGGEGCGREERTSSDVIE